MLPNSGFLAFTRYMSNCLSLQNLAENRRLATLSVDGDAKVFREGAILVHAAIQ